MIPLRQALELYARSRQPVVHATGAVEITFRTLPMTRLIVASDAYLECAEAAPCSDLDCALCREATP